MLIQVLPNLHRQSTFIHFLIDFLKTLVEIFFLTLTEHYNKFFDLNRRYFCYRRKPNQRMVFLSLCGALASNNFQSYCKKVNDNVTGKLTFN